MATPATPAAPTTRSPSSPSRRLSAAEINQLDPYVFFALLGKRVIHPGGRRSTEELLRAAQLTAGQHVLDVGCGVATTAIAIARRFGAHVTAVDIAPLMLERAGTNVQAAKQANRIAVEQGDISALRFADDTFDRVLAEAVTMFVDRRQAVRELVRVCKPGGLVLATEFLWRSPPSDGARTAFLGEVCPGMSFDSLDDWVSMYSDAGLADLRVTSGPFEMMTPTGFIADEGLGNCLAIMGRAFSRPAYLKKMLWLMPRVNRAVPYLGYIALVGQKPA
ncbi:MAG TPA: methyltransferase domain-containing protein [Ktedonobacterales bacterium]|nr:methyltransferase domain-containing protein [Ktedonobacterales bacterium]